MFSDVFADKAVWMKRKKVIPWLLKTKKIQVYFVRRGVRNENSGLPFWKSYCIVVGKEKKTDR